MFKANKNLKLMEENISLNEQIITLRRNINYVNCFNTANFMEKTILNNILKIEKNNQIIYGESVYNKIDNRYIDEEL